MGIWPVNSRSPVKKAITATKMLAITEIPEGSNGAEHRECGRWLFASTSGQTDC